jgi:large subunit ribosomal protein L23
MKQERLMNILLSPCVSEKATMVGEKLHQIVFKVAKDANKHEIKQAVKLMFSVEAIAVRTVNVKGKVRNFRQKAGRRKDWKKAYISLAEGQDINFLKQEQ